MLGVRCEGACAAMRISKKSLPRNGLTNLIMEPVLYGSRCSPSPKASSGETTRTAARPGCLPRRRGPRARDQAHPPRLNGCKFVLRRACKPRRRLTSCTRLGRRPPRAAREDQPERQSAKRVQKNQADETGREGQRSAIWRTDHEADRRNIKKQTVRSDWRRQLESYTENRG